MTGGSNMEQLLGGMIPLTDCFIFEIDGIEIGVFEEVSGLQVTVNTTEINEGGQNGFTHRVPGRMSWPNVTLKRGVTDGNALFEWLQESSGEKFATGGNKVARRTGAITSIDDVGGRLRSWELIDVFPVRWEGPKFSVNNSSPLEEELEVTHHGFRAVKPSATS